MRKLLRFSAPAKTTRHLLLSALFGLASVGAAQAQQQQLVWEENFDGPTINANNWTYDLGDGCAIGVCGWGNNELETYTNRPENARIENGNLVIEARREALQGKSFTSARLKTLGRVQFKYGTLEARIKVPNLQNGLWPAFWMLGATGVWPASGEVDIMEMGSAAAIAAGLTNRRVGGATHWENNGAHAAYDTKYDSPTDLTTDYHVYRMSWDSQFIRMFIDDREYYAINIAQAAAADLEEFHRAQFILLNLAVGGQYVGINSPSGITAALPATMQVDYVRLYQRPGDELYLGSANPISGNFGIYTENPAIANKLVYGQNATASLYLWNNLTYIATPAPTPFEGTEVLALRAAAGNWFGFGIETTQPKNLAAFAGGALRFNFKTTYAGQFKVGIKSGVGESWVNFPAGATPYGLVRDGQWHEVVIPIAAFGNGDLVSVGQVFMFAGDAATSAADFYFDNIHVTSAVATASKSASRAGAPALSLYPNPAQGRTKLEFATTRGADYRLAIYDLKGTLVKTLAAGRTTSPQALSFELNTKAYREGIYVIKLTTANEVTTKRLTISR
ncbi:family 16 glycosylhydrolase [uncultured Hymenobacter sp.]|uniref:family 16 glycosylhydrolase n=1 Tax=uncultured Hymenobacter sp. TaxID=170016 RepID=UPI0035CBA6AE